MVFLKGNLISFGCSKQQWPGECSRKVLIARASSRMNPNLVLDVARGAKKDEIRAAFLEKIRMLHPDVNEQDTTEEAARYTVVHCVLKKWNEGRILLA